MRRAIFLLCCVALISTVMYGRATANRNGSLRNFTGATHAYRVADVGNGVEASMAAHPNGTVFTAGQGVADWGFKTTNKGVTWVSIRHPGAQGLLNEGDVAVAPNGDVYVSWLDLSRLHASRIYVSRDEGLTFTEKLVAGPQIFPDRPWVLAAPRGAPGPDLGLISASAIGTQDWGSTDGGESYAHQTVASPGATVQDPPFTPNPFMDFAAPAYSGGSFGPPWIPLPEGGFLSTTSGRWTKDFETWFRTSPFLFEIPKWPHVKISSQGVLYQARLENGAKRVDYRFLKDGVWSEWRVAANFAAAGRFKHTLTETVIAALMTLNTYGDLLGIVARDGDQDLIIRVADADGASPVITRENIGGVAEPVQPRACTARYDYPTLVFDAQGLAVISYCAGRVAYEQP